MKQLSTETSANRQTDGQRNCTYGGVDKAKENNSSYDDPNGLNRTLLEALCYHLVETVAHTTQLRRKSTKRQQCKKKCQGRSSDSETPNSPTHSIHPLPHPLLRLQSSISPPDHSPVSLLTQNSPMSTTNRFSCKNHHHSSDNIG